MGHEVIHLTEDEAIRDIAAILERVGRGAEVIVEREDRAVAIIQPPPPHPGRLLSECLALAEARGSMVTLDDEFGTDLEAVIESHREPLDSSPWE